MTRRMPSLACAFFGWDEMPKPTKVIPDVNIDELDGHARRHILPNMSPPIWRGLWYPAANLTEQLPYERSEKS
jgi:hypothetical protein